MIEFNNDTALIFTLQDSSISEPGAWLVQPWPKFGPGGGVQFGSTNEEMIGFGTYGTVNYQSSAGLLTISWSNPFSGGNSYTTAAPAGYTLTQQGDGGGDEAYVGFLLQQNQ